MKWLVLSVLLLTACTHETKQTRYQKCLMETGDLFDRLDYKEAVNIEDWCFKRSENE